MNLSSANKTYTIFLWCKRNYWHRLIDGDQDRHLHPFFFFFSLSFVRNIDDDPTVYKACKLVNVSQVLSSSFNCPLLSSIMPRTSSKPKTLPAVYVEMYVLLHYCYYECCSNNLLLIAKSLLVLEMAVLLEWRSLPPSPSKCVLHFLIFLFDNSIRSPVKKPALQKSTRKIVPTELEKYVHIVVVFMSGFLIPFFILQA